MNVPTQDLLFLTNLIQEHLVSFILILIWTVAWKGMALWTAARQRDRWWFIALLVVNTLSLLELLYIFVFSKRKFLQKEGEQSKQ